MSHVHDYIYLEQQDKGYYTGNVIFDLEKSFDTVNHKIRITFTWEAENKW